jgi:hypothetical protein
MIRNILIILIGVFLFSSLIKNITELQKNKRFYIAFQDEYEREKDKNNKLNMQAVKEADRLELEKTIRNKLNLLKDNEIAIIVPTPTLEPPMVSLTPLPVYQQWLHVFFKN